MLIIIIITSAKLKPRGDDKVIDNHISNAKLFIGKTNSWLKMMLLFKKFAGLERKI